MFILRRLLEENHANEKKLYMCFVDVEKAQSELLYADDLVLMSGTIEGLRHK